MLVSTLRPMNLLKDNAWKKLEDLLGKKTVDSQLFNNLKRSVSFRQSKESEPSIVRRPSRTLIEGQGDSKSLGFDHE